MPIEIRAIDEGELDTFHISVSAGFLGDDHPGQAAAFAAVEDLSRALGAFDGQEMVGTLGAFSLEENDGCYSLEVEAGAAKCRRTSDSAEIELDVADLASVYLGAHSFTKLSRAGRVRGTEEAIRRADGIFRAALAPWCPEIF